MKISKRQLKTIIREEYNKLYNKEYLFELDSFQLSGEPSKKDYEDAIFTCYHLNKAGKPWEISKTWLIEGGWEDEEISIIEKAVLDWINLENLYG